MKHEALKILVFSSLTEMLASACSTGTVNPVAVQEARCDDTIVSLTVRLRWPGFASSWISRA